MIAHERGRLEVLYTFDSYRNQSIFQNLKLTDGIHNIKVEGYLMLDVLSCSAHANHSHSCGRSINSFYVSCSLVLNFYKTLFFISYSSSLGMLEIEIITSSL